MMHFAALAYVGEFVERPDLYYRTNVGGTIALLEAMRLQAWTGWSSPAPAPPMAMPRAR